MFFSSDSKYKISHLGINVIECTNEDLEKELQHIDYVSTDSERRVMGLAQMESSGLKISPDPNFLWTVPNIWPSEDAVTVPYAYVMVILLHLI